LRHSAILVKDAILQSSQIRRCDIGNAGRFRLIPANQIVTDRISKQFPLNQDQVRKKFKP
jgi:hypothetical protein